MKYVDTLHTHEKPNKRQSEIVIWVPHTADVLKISFDGAYIQKEKKGAWGFIARVTNGIWCWLVQEELMWCMMC